MVRAAIEPGWHTFAMDNKQRAEEKLAGRKSLGIDHPTEITLTGGLEMAGPWYQTPPKDFSKPELRWFSWGFERQALFAAKIRRRAARGADGGAGSGVHRHDLQEYRRHDSTFRRRRAGWGIHRNWI